MNCAAILAAIRAEADILGSVASSGTRRYTAEDGDTASELQQSRCVKSFLHENADREKA